MKVYLVIKSTVEIRKDILEYFVFKTHEKAVSFCTSDGAERIYYDDVDGEFYVTDPLREPTFEIIEKDLI